MAEIVEDGRTGLHFTPGDAQDLAAKVEWAWSHPERMRLMGEEARREYESKYTAEKNYPLLAGNIPTDDCGARLAIADLELAGVASRGR